MKRAMLAIIISTKIEETPVNLSEITFFERFEEDILSGKKIITIRDVTESKYVPDSIVRVTTYETGRFFCSIKIKSVESIAFNDLSNRHAEQENMSLSALKKVIEEIYPNEKKLYVVSYELVG